MKWLWAREGVPSGGRDRAAPGLGGVLRARESWVFLWTPGGPWGFGVVLGGGRELVRRWLLPNYRDPLRGEGHSAPSEGLCLNHPLICACRTAGSRSLMFPPLEGIWGIATRPEGRNKGPSSAETAQGGSRELGGE